MKNIRTEPLNFLTFTMGIKENKDEEKIMVMLSGNISCGLDLSFVGVWLGEYVGNIGNAADYERL